MKGAVIQLTVDHALIRPGALSSTLLAGRCFGGDGGYGCRALSGSNDWSRLRHVRDGCGSDLLAWRLG
jgi:hypothetical protein